MTTFFKNIKKHCLTFWYWLRHISSYLVVLLLTGLMLFAYFWPQIIITVNSGEGGVLYRRFFGTVTDKVYGEGIHIIFPWDTMYIYNTRIQTVLHDFDVLTNQGLPIHLSLAIRFRPDYELLGLLHQQVGPDYINSIVTPEVESVLRKRLSPYNPEDIYMNKDNILIQVTIESMEGLGKKYVMANDVIIREISLPKQIREAIENKMTEQQREQAYLYRLRREEKEAQRKRVEAEGIKNYQHIISETLSDQLLKWQGIQATLDLAGSDNAKIVVIGKGMPVSLPIMLGSEAQSVNKTSSNNKTPADTPANDLFQHLQQ